MSYWDSSALVPLIVPQQHKKDLVHLYEQKGHVITWELTSVEVVSSLTRLVRTKDISSEESQVAEEKWNNIVATLELVDNSEELIKTAKTLLRRYPLKAADSLQLAAALVACLGRPSGHSFITLDQNLAICAYKEGFNLLPKSILKNAKF